MDLNGKAAAAAAWCFGFIHVDVKLMELRSVEKIQKKNRLPWNQKNKFWFTDKRIKICSQPCFRFVKAKLLHRVCLLQLPLGSNLAGTQTQDSKQTKQWTLFSERLAELAANEKAEEGLSPLPDAGVKHLPAGDGGHKGRVQKSQSYHDKDIFIYVDTEYFHRLKSIISIIQSNNNKISQ